MKLGRRIIERFAILVPGVVIAYLSVRDIFPYFHGRLPYGVAVLATYALGAYVLIPALIRLIRSVRPVKHLPHYCVTPDGFASDPLNIGVIGTRHQLIDAMERSGWQVADERNLRTLTRQVLSVLLQHSYARAPVSNLYLFGRKQDIAFEVHIPGQLASRHHVRFWATTYEPKRRLSRRNIHWRERTLHYSHDEPLWLGAASLDVGLTFIRHNFQISHMIHPDTDQERNLIVSQLKAAKQVKKTETVTLTKAYRLVNRVWRGYLQTDGKMTIIHLK